MCCWEDKEIRLRLGLTEAQYKRTLLHELFHATNGYKEEAWVDTVSDQYSDALELLEDTIDNMLIP